MHKQDIKLLVSILPITSDWEKSEPDKSTNERCAVGLFLPKLEALGLEENSQCP